MFHSAFFIVCFLNRIIRRLQLKVQFMDDEVKFRKISDEKGVPDEEAWGKKRNISKRAKTRSVIKRLEAGRTVDRSYSGKRCSCPREA